MSRLVALRVAHSAAEVRLRIAQRNLVIYANDADMLNETQARTVRKLTRDVDAAVANLQFIAREIEQCRDVEGVNL